MSFKVNPFGEIENTADCGTLMGNRGVLAVENGELVGLSRWKSQSWIYCSIDPKFKPKEGEKPPKYTKLFFMDEYTALAAGHRPCGYCLRKSFDEFIDAWLAGNPEHDFQKDIPKQIDRMIHKERTSRMRGEETYRAGLTFLPSGVMVVLPENATDCYLWQAEKLFKWSPVGYAKPISYEQNTVVEIVTPKTVVNAIRAGFIPEVEVLI